MNLSIERSDKFASPVLNRLKIEATVESMLALFWYVFCVVYAMTDFESRLLSGQLIIVTDGVCNDECKIVLEKIRSITDRFYFTDINKDYSTKQYMDLINYSGEYPIYFYKKRFIPDILEDSDLDLILDDL